MEHLDSNFKRLVEEVKKGSGAKLRLILTHATQLEMGALRMVGKNESIEKELMNIVRAAKLIIGDITQNRSLYEIIGRARAQFNTINENLKAAAAVLKYVYEEITT